MKTIVTGGAGFIGSNLVDALIANGNDVTILDDLSTGNRKNINPGARFLQFDLSKNPKTLIGLLRGTDVIFHCAAIPRIPVAQADPVKTDMANVHGTISLYTAAVAAGVKKIVYSSSSSVYGKYSGKATELWTPNPINFYALQKLTGERYAELMCRYHKISITCLRYFNVYGNRMTAEGYGTVIGKFLQAKKDGKPLTIYGTGEQLRDFTHVSDVVCANLLAAQKADGFNIYNIGVGLPISISYIAKNIGGDLIFEPKREGDTDWTCADNSKAKAELGWERKMLFGNGLHELKKQWLS